MTYQEACEYLGNIPPFIPKKLAPMEEPFNLKKITILLRYLGNPQGSLRFVHITGSNGKGSASAYLTQILTAAGYRIGLYTSPAIREIRERIRIGSEQIPEDAFASYTERVRRVSDRMDREGEGFPSEFEQMTAIALLYFLEQKCDLVVLEVGLGGRLDATNVIPAPLLAIFTPISKEHTEVLGETLSEIAREKAGIIKEGSRVLTAPQEEAAEEVLRAVCGEKKVPLYRASLPVSRHFDGEVQSFAMSAEGLPDGIRFDTKMAAFYQADNAALAVQAALLLKEDGYNVSVKALTEGVYETKWPGRFEIIRSAPWVILDGSHNPAGARALSRCLRECFPGKKIRFLTGVLADKEYKEMMQEVLPLAECFYTVTPSSSRALDAKELASYLSREGAQAKACRDTMEAVRLSMMDLRESSVICAFGSLYQLAEYERCLLLFAANLQSGSGSSCLHE